MKIKKIIIGSLTVIIGLPLFLILVLIGYYYLADKTNGTLVSSGEKREYLLHVPESYVPANPAPLVISMHGTALWPANQMKISHWNEVADENGFIVVFPSGKGGIFNRKWSLKPGVDLDKDVQYISDLIDNLGETYNIDYARIYANGLSAGGGMAIMLSCRLSDRIAAVGTVAPAHLPVGWCGDSRPMPLISFHGTADSLVPYNGGTSWAADIPFESVTKWAANWAEKNHCNSDPVESREADDVERLEYTECGDGASVVLYSIDGGGHTWPGGESFPEWLAGHTSDSIDATDLTWEFFSRHRLIGK
jgi:polyhydroxybutyrate depolymerase